MGTVTEINTAEVALLNAQMSQIAAVDLAFTLGEIGRVLPN
ncbi:hypothetical protein [Proteus terrae]|nr:hypothetical protein [Proteus terrae]